MLTIFHAPPTRSFRVLWLAEEAGLPYQLRKETLGRPSAELTALNPLKTLPTVCDGDLVLTESAAALQYLAEKHASPLAVTREDPLYPAWLEALHFGESSLSAFLTPLVLTRFMAPADQKENWTANQLKEMFVGRLAYLEGRLASGGPHVLGERFTAADICIGYALRFGAAMGLAQRFPEGVSAYWARLQARPAFQRATAAGS